MKIKYLKRADPRDKAAPMKWYASPMPDQAEDTKTMTRAATENTTTSPLEMESAIALWGNYASKRLLAGESVRVGELGTLRLTFHSKGVESIDDVNAGQMIYDVRLRFTPSKEFRENIVPKVTFECGGVLDEGVNYSSLNDYRVAKGLAPAEPSTPGGGGTGTGDDGEGTLG